MDARRQALDEERARKLLAERKRREKERGKLDFDLISFGPQREFVRDPSKRVAAWTSRQSGKSHGTALKMLETVLRIPKCTVLYITNTRRQAKRVMWDLTLLPLLAELGIPYHPNQNELQISFDNGSRILMGGANDSSEVEHYRGIFSPLIVLDEAQSFRSFLKTLIKDILAPCLWKYNGQLVMIGTPNASCFGYFHDVCKGAEKGWSMHHWTMLDNPHLPNPAQIQQDKLETEGLRPDDPGYLREYCGIWVRDTQGLVYNFDQSHVVVDPPEWFDTSYILGIDFGYTDDTAFVVQAFSPSVGKICTVESFSGTNLIPSAVAGVVSDLEGRYDFEAIVGDMGGLGKGYAEEMIQRYGIPVEAAEKKDKAGAIELLNGDLRKGKISVLESTNQELIDDLRLLQWNYDKIDKKKHGGRIDRLALEIDDSTPDHLPDAWLYSYRKCRHYFPSEADTGPEKGSSQWWEQYEDDLWAAQQKPAQEWSLEHEQLAGEDAF